MRGAGTCSISAGLHHAERIVLRVFACVIRRELLLAFRRRSDVLAALVFFVIAAALFPLGVGPERALLRTMAPGILWVAALLASMLSLGRLFALDLADGTLEQMLLSAEPLPVIVIGKVLAHWVVSGLPLTLLAPLLALQFDLPGASIAVLSLSLLIGTPVLSLFGAIGAALTLGVRGGGVLVSLLVLPLYAPVLIFGAGAVAAQTSGMESAAHLLLLGGLLAGAAALAPWAVSSALRIAFE
jgi:heme exporter protein B